MNLNCVIITLTLYWVAVCSHKIFLLILIQNYCHRVFRRSRKCNCHDFLIRRTGILRPLDDCRVRLYAKRTPCRESTPTDSWVSQYDDPRLGKCHHHRQLENKENVIN